MYMCEDCGKQFEEEEIKSWTEPHGEQLTGCPMCYGSYVEIEPCVICGEYPEADEYSECCRLFGGACKACFDAGIKAHFMEYLSTLDNSNQILFYFGDCDGGYVYDALDILLEIRPIYSKRVEMHDRVFGPEYEANKWKEFIQDTNTRKFVEWLVKRKANEHMESSNT